MSRFRGALPVLLLLASAPAWPCGESMFRVGFGMEIPAGTVQQPANIVIFRASDSSPDVFFDDAKVSAKLDKAGHHVTRVEAGADAAAAQNVDVVLARAAEIDRARAELGSRWSNAVFLPVNEGFARSSSGSELSLAANSTLHQILGVLSQAMQAVAGN